MSKPLILFGPSPPPYGGVSVFLSSLYRLLRNSNVRLWTYFGKPTADPRISRINHRRLGVIHLLLREGWKARIVDLSHFHLEHPNAILLPIWLSAKVLLRFYWYKYILDGTLPARHAHFTPLRRSLFWCAVRASDEFLVSSEELAHWLKQEIKVSQKVTVIPCLLNTTETSPASGISAELERRLKGFFSHPKKISVIGTFIPEYGFAQVANAVEKLRSDMAEHIGLLLLDGAFAGDESYREQVLTNRPWVTVLSDVPNAEVHQILRRCDLFVRAVAAEGYGISRVEAIWCGVPVIATNVGETRGMLTYEFGDEKKLAELIQASLFQKVVATEELREAAELFRSEADENLRMFIETAKVR